ncbi:hypothetical protein AHAS_Ahas19G0170800 [Arachis hypogaea]
MDEDTNVEPMFDYHGFDEGYNIDSLEDIGMIEFWNIRDEDVCHFHFSDVNIAFEFYNRYARTKSFSARKNRTRKSHAGALKLKNFVCHREGFKPQNNYGIGNLKRKHTPETRCGCSAMMEIRVDAPSGRWFISYFSDKHNHPLLDPRLTGLLPGHRFMFEADIGHMVNMKKGGISVRQIYRALANQTGGYEYLSFMQRDMYNKIAKQRRQLPGDAYEALKYLEDQATNDPSLYFNHHMDADGTLRNLFWCDGLSRANYSLFGDVLAFDATYRKNKYMCPLVVFFGVNHHNQTIIFAAALICDEEKDTYRWLLQQLKVAMNGKAPVSVITDGDLSMKFTIEKEFPNAHHRLCAWHLIRNATSNIGKPLWKEVQADLASVNGRPSMQTCFQQLKRSAANVYTLSIFHMFQPILVRAASMKEEDAAQKELVNDADSVRDGVQVDAFGAGLATNDLGYSMPRDPRKYRTKGGLHSLIKENIDVDSVSEGHGNDTFDNDSDDHMNIEDDSLVYDENASYNSNEVL